MSCGSTGSSDRGVARADAEARMAAQATDEERRAVATWVLHNDGDRAHLERQVETVWADLVARNAALADASFWSGFAASARHDQNGGGAE